MAEDGRRALTVGEMMHTRVVLTTPDSPMSEAAAEMVRERVGSALVMQGAFLAGILTERDILRAAASGTDLTAVQVSAWMTKDPQSAEPDTTVEDAAQMMLLNGFRHLPIMEGRTVRGVVSLRDLFAARISRPSPQRGAGSLPSQTSSRAEVRLDVAVAGMPPLRLPPRRGLPKRCRGRPCPVRVPYRR